MQTETAPTETATGRIATALRRTESRPAAARSARIAGVWDWVLALVDQGCVSGTRFVSTIIIGRACGPAQLGTYSLAFSVLVLAGCLQEAILTTPYAVLGQRLGRRARSSYAGAIAHMHLLTALTCAAILVALGFTGWALHAEVLEHVALVLAITLPCSLAAEFARRFALAHVDVRWALRLDAGIAAVQLIILLLLARLEWLSGQVALLVVGAAYLAPALWWWTFYGRNRVRAARFIVPYWRRNWSLGRWLLASQLMSAIHGLMPTWLLAALVDTQATGHFVAHFNLALLANPLIFAVGNLLTPRAAQARARGGAEAVQNIVFRVLFCLLGVMAVFAIGLHLAGDELIQIIYGKSFAGSEQVAGVLGLTAIMWAISATFFSGLAALGRPRWSFIASCVGTTVTAIGILLFAANWGVYGASLGLFLGSMTSAVIHAWTFIGCSGGLSIRRFTDAAPTYDSRLTTQEFTNA